MRLWKMTIGAVPLLMCASAASAEAMSFFQCSTQVSRGAVTTVYSSGVFHAPHSAYSARDYAEAFKQFLVSRGIAAPYASCSTSQTRERGFKALDNARDFAERMKGRFTVVGWAPSGGEIVNRGAGAASPEKKAAQSDSGEASGRTIPASKTGEIAPSGTSAEAPTKTRADHEAEFQAKLRIYEAERKAWESKIAAQTASEERKKAAHAAAQQKARQAQAAHEARMASFQRVLEDQQRRQREYEAALAQNNRCRDGDQQACADIRAGRLASGVEQLASSEEPKTSDDEARTCVTEPVVSASKTWKGALQAVAFNGCKKPVDLRICLLRTGGWNCGMALGVKPQDRWTWWSHDTQGEIFWDARLSGSDEPLASPGAD